VTRVHVSDGDTVKVGQVLVTLEAEDDEAKGEIEDKAEAGKASKKPAEPKAAREASQPEKTAAGKKADSKEADTEPDDSGAEGGEPGAASVSDEGAADEGDTEPPPKKTATGKRTEAAPDRGAATRPDQEDKQTSRGERKSAEPAEKSERPGARPTRHEATEYPEPARRADGSRPGSEIAAGPALRRFARELGVDLGSVTGTGPGGRIVRDDILRVVRSGGTRSTSATGENDGYGPVRYEKLTRMRRTIAEQMHRSWSTVPRVTNFDDADVTDLENIRQSSKGDYAARSIRLTSLPFVIKAVAMALRQHPVVNASIDMEAGQIIYKEYVNIGIAVDTERGLVVPCLRQADTLSIPEIARRLGELADRAMAGDYTVEDLRGGTFTISNLGAIGGTWSTPIVNVPETAVLLVGRSRKLPVVMEESIVPRLMMPLSISYDHRLIDGAAAARFLNDVIAYLEAPSRLLLAP
jgi:pyruvate/2-oxoglutarate dehydrogenase complex dihydrolipoamide acyltransferase (E2) component